MNNEGGRMQEEKVQSVISSIRYLKDCGETLVSLRAKSLEELKVKLTLNCDCTVEVDDDFVKSVLEAYELTE